MVPDLGKRNKLQSDCKSSFYNNKIQFNNTVTITGFRNELTQMTNIIINNIITFHCWPTNVYDCAYV